MKLNSLRYERVSKKNVLKNTQTAHAHPDCTCAVWTHMRSLHIDKKSGSVHVYRKRDCGALSD